MSSSQMTFQFLAEPTDVNFGGKVHGGMIMKWIDQAAYACAAQWSGLYCVTVSANGIRFIRPVHVGQVVSIQANIVHTGHSSMHMYVTVSACNPHDGKFAIANRCFITFMAVDDKGQPSGVPQYIPESEEAFQLELVAMHAKDFAKELDQDFQSSTGHH
ncbi:acyl-CoA thioesterase [Alteromonas sp. 1_MG-2023]|uniref:acyl-CoA thioesterase n=1 Tax=Alteromonas sp. 1_MG-2023 TaxID=3062669 RepID=UPI0026E1A0D1|nr:acyl-CoA thioesterase [Alteromonas sp. 1_MG-2023]MDO6473838.1 acyl-CoA thioesterase [Alteromonas sp. 1_MG-2023]